ncbi:MAG: glutamate-5-semialdehyde dehydrogenase [Spirochaetes bacterium]|nr:glutamate-5-semialdehyde dehydrogenase [Spirochaetota bacterium]MBN2770868.1 glutamate-5-semialdehyde dehydrogenase [Spirochaetota bacterium]
MTLHETAQHSKKASIYLASKDENSKNSALETIAQQLDSRREEIKAANSTDIQRSKSENLAQPLLKRLLFDDNKIDQTIAGIKDLVTLKDPVGKTLLSTELDTGLELYKISCPIGVIGVIFESRPDALVQIATLCLKSGNALLLKGGSEAMETNRILADIIYNASLEASMPEGWLYLLETRSEVKEMLSLDDSIDLIIPRGSNEFVKYIMDNSNIPVLGHADGICHLYIDKEADTEMAVNLTIDSKVQSVAVCNALETLLVHEDIAEIFLPAVRKRLDESGVKITGCDKTARIIECEAADDNTWKNEYLDYKLSIKVVSSLEEAVDHINCYGSGHTDSIVTNNGHAAGIFMDLVDSGNVFWNASTRFSDGFVYGFGAEVGISTNKIHARGPVGLEGLLIYKYKLIGRGHVRADYTGGSKRYTHNPINKPYPHND